MASAGGRITAGVGANLIGQHAHDRNQEATCYVGNLDDQATEELLWELFTQAGPVHHVYMPKDRVTNKHRGHAFVEFKGEEDADYAIKVLNMIKLFGKPIRVNKASQDKKSTDIGANLFVGNLDPDVDEKMLYDTFSAFGVIVATPKIMRDPDTGISKGYGFVSFDNFESSDTAVEAMHGQFLMNRAISVQYAFKKDSNERHGTPAERLMAQQYRLAAMKSSKPHTMFASAPNQTALAAGALQPPSAPAPAPVPALAPAPGHMPGHLAHPGAAPHLGPGAAANPPLPPWQTGQVPSYPGARPPSAPPPWAQHRPPSMPAPPSSTGAPLPPWMQGSGAGVARPPPSHMAGARPPPPMNTGYGQQAARPPPPSLGMPRPPPFMQRPPYPPQPT